MNNLLDIKRFSPHIISIVIFILLSSVFFSPIFQGKVLSTHDIDNWKGMSKEIVDYRLETGKEALWTKRMFSGMPSYQISTKSKGNLIQYIDKFIRLGLPRPIDLLFLYLLGFYILLCSLKIDYKLSIVGAISFAFSSYFIIILQAGHMTKAHAIAYLPLIIASVLYTYKSEKFILGSLFTALFVALQLYSNHYQITYYTIIILFFIGVVQFYKQFKEKSLKSFVKKSFFLILAAILGGLTNFTRLSTTLDYGSETQRGKSELLNNESEVKKDGLSLEYATRWSYGKMETLTFLIPNFMGGSTGKSVLEDDDSHTFRYLRSLRNQKKQQNLQKQTSTYWGNQPGTSPTYVGSIIVFLFVFGILYVKSKLRIWILITTILSILLAWGNNFIELTEFFFNYIPAYNKFRAVTMSMIIAEFGISLLAIIALNDFFKNDNNKDKISKMRLSFYITGGVTLLFALIPGLFVNFLNDSDLLNKNLEFINYLAIDRENILKNDAWRSFGFILIAYVLLSMFVKNIMKKKYIVFILGTLILIDLWSVDKRYLNESHFIKKSSSNINPSSANKFILKNNKNKSRVFNLNNPFNESNTSYFHNSIGGYHAAKLLRYQEIIDNHLVNNNKSVLSMLNCGWIINPSGQALESSSQGINPLGDAWFVSEFKLVENANEELESLNNFDPEKTLIVDKRFSKYISYFVKDDNSSIELDLDSYQPNHLTYNLNGIKDNHLAVFSEIYYKKGWNAYIDDVIVPHFRSNYILRALLVPKGTQKIEFKFEPNSYLIGEILAYSSSILLLVLLVFFYYRKIK